jgi:hypothetical protein
MPLRFAGSMIELIGEAVQVGEWIVGYPPFPVPGEEERWVGHSSIFVGPDEAEDFLVRAVSYLASQAESGEEARRFLLRNGTFRQSDWYSVEHVLGSGLPADVIQEVKRLKLPPTARVYVLQVKQFYKEWRLLRALALISGEMAKKANLPRLNEDIQSAGKILKDLELHASLPAAQSKSTGPNPYSIFKTPTKQAGEVSSKTQAKQTLADKVRTDAPRLYDRAIRRGIGTNQFSVGWARFDAGLRVSLNVSSTLGLAYCGLLANFARGWKCCEREDCGNIFRVTDDKRKKFPQTSR